ncbi:MAG: hypothetical protein RIC89_18115 [Pseudomonadales bacterium]
MDRDDYIEGIHGAWLGERFGESFFTALAEKTPDSAMRPKWQRLAQLENVTGRKMAALLEAHGESATTSESTTVGDEVVGRYLDGSHLDAMLKLKEVIEKAIIRFDQLLALAPDEDVPAVQFLVQHEQALLTFVEREIAGDADHALDDIDQLLVASSPG